ncbi:MAG: cation:proton antiporter [Deltaproteobacteria bacterium]
MDRFVFELSVLFVGAAVLSYAAVLLRQPIIVAYVACGVLLGPWGAGWIRQVDFIDAVSRLGITLLLFLAGLCLHPQKLVRVFRKAFPVAAGNCLFSFVLAFTFARLFGFGRLECLVIGLAMMFSSTILVVKLLPTTRLHHGHMGAVCIGVLILEDLLAVVVLAFLRCLGVPGGAAWNFGIVLFKLAGFLVALFLFEQYVLRRAMQRAERLHEILFVLGLAWCFGVAGISNRMGLFYETGAFFAGVVLARHPVSLFISERLKPLRDFFLVLFFVALGAQMNLRVMREIWFACALLAALICVVKPWFLKHLFLYAKEEAAFSKEAGLRLGQLSEFSLLIALLALQLGRISSLASQFIQLVTLLTFVFSSYRVVFRYPTPIGPSEKLNRD